MIRVLDWFARVSTKAPAFTLLTLFAVTIGLGAAATQLEVDASMDGFAPEGGIADTLTEVDDRFGTDTSVQVLLDAGDGGNVIEADTLADMDVLVARLESHPDIMPALAEESAGQPAVISFAFPFDEAAEAFDSSLSELDEQMVETVAATLFENGSEEITGLFSNDLVTDPPQARSGMVIVNMDADEPLSVRNEASRAIEDVVDATEVGETRRSVMSMTAIESGVMDSIARDMPVLLSLSLLFVVSVLVLLFRSFVDVLVGMTGLVVSIVWMVGIAAILGPGVAGWVGPFNQISVAVPVLLVGLGIDYSVHLTTRYREQRTRGDGPTRAARVAATTVGVALVLATIASIAGFLANLVTPLPPIRDFGIFAAIGISTAFVILSAAVPAARTLVDRRAERRAGRKDVFSAVGQPALGTAGQSTPSSNGAQPPADEPPKIATRDSHAAWWVRALTFTATRLPMPVIAITAVLMIVGGIAATGLSTEFNERDFLPEGEPVLRTIDRMDDQFGGEVGEQTFVMIDGDVTDPDLLAAMSLSQDNLADVDQVRTNGAGVEVQSILTLRDQIVSSGESVREQIASDIEAWHDPEAAAAETDLPDPIDVDAFADDLEGELDLPDELVDALDVRLPSERAAAAALASTMDPEELEEQIREQLVDEFAAERPDGLTDDAVERLAQLDTDELTLSALEDAGYPLVELSDDDHQMLERLDAIEAAGDVDDGTDGDTLAAQLAVLHQMVPDELASVIDDDGLLLIASTTAGYLGAGDLVDELATALAPVQEAGGEVVVASDPLLNAEIIDELADAQLMAIVISLVAAALLLVIAMWVSARSVALGLIGIVPSVVALALVLGTMRVLDMPFNALTATVASIAVGIGVPYGIHLTNRFSEGVRIGLNAEEAALDTLSNTGAAMVGSALTTGLAFGVLMLSTSTPLQQFGTVSTLMIGLAGAGCLLVQPAMLVLWGRHRVKKNRRSVAPDQANEMIKVPEGTKS